MTTRSIMTQQQGWTSKMVRRMMTQNYSKKGYQHPQQQQQQQQYPQQTFATFSTCLSSTNVTPYSYSNHYKNNDDEGDYSMLSSLSPQMPRRKDYKLDNHDNHQSNNLLQKRFFSSAGGNNDSLSLSEMIESKIKNNKVVVFSKLFCPFCRATKQLFLNTLELPENNIEIIELDQIPNGHDIQKELYAMTGQRTVPNVFVNGKHIGGNDATQAAARSGELQKMLQSNE